MKKLSISDYINFLNSVRLLDELARRLPAPRRSWAIIIHARQHVENEFIRATGLRRKGARR